MTRGPDGRRLPTGSALGPRSSGTVWAKAQPVAWVDETGRRVANIAERALVCRWTADADPSALMPGRIMAESAGKESCYDRRSAQRELAS